MRAPPSDRASWVDRAACAASIKTGSRSFYLASKLLPKRVREPAFALYAFCRVSDDLVDEGADPRAAVAHLRARLDRVYAGRADDAPVDRAFADAVRDFAIPRALPEALIEGFAWDAEGRRCADLPALRAYAARVAGAVGAMMAALMAARTPELLARACDLGVAMQLTNVARDVGEDARNGRLYLPMDWMREEGIDPDAFLARPGFSPALGRVVKRVLDEAEALYARADSGIAGLPLDCRASIYAASRVYREIGRVVARNGFDSVAARARVGDARKLALMARAGLAAAVVRPGRSAAPALPETRFLVAAVEAQPAPPDARARGFLRSGERLAELFLELERRERERNGTVPSQRIVRR